MFNFVGNLQLADWNWITIHNLKCIAIATSGNEYGNILPVALTCDRYNYSVSSFGLFIFHACDTTINDDRSSTKRSFIQLNLCNHNDVSLSSLWVWMKAFMFMSTVRTMDWKNIILLAVKGADVLAWLFGREDFEKCSAKVPNFPQWIQSIER